MQMLKIKNSGARRVGLYSDIQILQEIAPDFIDTNQITRHSKNKSFCFIRLKIKILTVNLQEIKDI